MHQEVKIGQTDYTVLVLIKDTAFAPKTGLAFGSPGIDVCYTRVEIDNDVVLAAGAPVDLASPALTDVHLDWGFLEVDATNAPGLYRLDIPDAVFAAGAWSAVVTLIATGCTPTHIEFTLVPEAPRTGVVVSSLVAGAINAAAIANAAIDAATFAEDMDGEIAAIVWNAATATYGTADTYGAAVEAIKAKTDNLPSSIPKGVALSDFGFAMFSNMDHVTPIAGMTVSSYISQDGAAFAATTNAVFEIESGVYKIDLTAAEMNAEFIILRFVATGAEDVIIGIKTDS